MAYFNKRYYWLEGGLDVSELEHPSRYILISKEEAAELLRQEYLQRIVGKPGLSFEIQHEASHWLMQGLYVQPYHFRSYKGRPLNRADEIAWLSQVSEATAFSWALTGRDITILRDRIKSPYLAFSWAKFIGDRDIMRERVTSAESAFYWAYEFSEHEIMRVFVTESRWAYTWARDIGDREAMRDRVTEPEWAYRWACDIGDREVMRDRVTAAEWAFKWARDIGDKERMYKYVVGDPVWLDKWEQAFVQPGDFSRIHSL